MVVAGLALAGIVRAGTWSVPGMEPGERPRTLYGPGEAGEIQARLTREPYASIYLKVVQMADRAYDLDDHQSNAEQLKGNIAQAAAFVYAMSRTARQTGDTVSVEPFSSDAERRIYGARAAELVAGMMPTCRIIDYTSTTLDILCAQELAMYATAYDILAGSGYPLQDAAALEDRLATFAADFFYKWTEAYWLTINRAANTNHGSKTAAALGLAAIVLNGYEHSLGDELDEYRDPAAWIDFGISTAETLGLGVLTSIDGAYAEGPTYFRYAAINLAPFYWAWHRYTRGAGWTVDGVLFPDPWTNPRLALCQDWLLEILMPDGTFPPFDDGTPGITNFWGPFCGLPNGQAYLWAWQRGVASYDTSGSVDQSLLTLVAYDDSLQARRPDIGPSIFSPENGHAVFRSGWGADDTYLIMMAEHGIAAGFAFRYDGEPLEGSGGHEHSDPGTTHLMSHGEVLLLDSGYLGWENHDKVRHPANHNILLVDGRGPQDPQLSIPPFTIEDGGIVITDPSREGGWVPGVDSPATLSRAFSTPAIEHARVTAHYFTVAPETNWTRRMLFVDHAFFVQADTVETADGESHELALLNHLNGGGTSGGDYEQLADGARVVRPGATLELRVAAAGGNLSLSTTQDVHDAWHWREETHTVLHTVVDGPRAAFMTLLFPLAPAEAAPVVEAVAAGDSAAAFRITQAGRVHLAAVALPGAGEITAGDLVLTGAMAIAGPDVLFLGDGTGISSAGREVVLDQPGTLTVSWEAGGLSGYYAGPANQIRFTPVPAAAGGEGFCEARLESGSLSLRLPGPGPFAVTFEGPAGNHAPQAAIAGPGSTRVGEPVELDGSASCDADGDALDYHWSVLEHPLRSTAVCDTPHAATTLFAPDWPGHYRLALVVSDGLEESRQATVLVWVDRAQDEQLDAGLDGDGGSAGDYESNGGQGGCGCASGNSNSGSLIWLLWLAWCIAHRQRHDRLLRKNKKIRK